MLCFSSSRLQAHPVLHMTFNATHLGESVRKRFSACEVVGLDKHVAVTPSSRLVGFGNEMTLSSCSCGEWCGVSPLLGSFFHSPLQRYLCCSSSLARVQSSGQRADNSLLDAG